ncbi:MAG: DUF1553 domain-containing protein [Planctomycetota bacterium]|nr:DUF1553 domain-containing protein [Planctomycetota bacterium]MDA1214251.1 DUF1553 domain-containing protein [Planctomycetota bacterium]
MNTLKNSQLGVTSVLIGLLALYLPGIVAADDPSTTKIDYLKSVKPLLEHRCFSCHGPLKEQSGLRLDTAASMKTGGDSGPIVIPGDANNSLLIQVITGEAGFTMPPEGEGAPLKDNEITLLRQWIDEGANAPADEQPAADPRTYWSYKPLTNPPVPDVKNVDWVRNPIDAFIAAEHERLRLTARPAADPETLLRRVYIDLIGLPPTQQELRAFLDDPSDNVYEQTVDRLLNSAQYGERWGRHWMDVWRYSDWYGSRGINEIRYGQRHIWRWRDWIVESLNADKGYDRMIHEMLAGDEIEPGNPEVIRATGFLGRNWYKFDRNVWLYETVEQTSVAFMGLTMRCARCHDHKFDPIAQLDYYRFRAFFEPHDVRTIPVTGDLATEKDATLGQVFKAGVSQVFDKEAETPTYLFVRGDDRNPDTDHPLTPGVPAILGNADLDISPVEIPLEAYYPWLNPTLTEKIVATAEEKVELAQAKLTTAQQQSVEAQKQLDQFVAEASADDRAASSTHLPGALFADDFSEPRTNVWNVHGGEWKYENGKVAQTVPGSFLAMSANVVLPVDFAGRVKYKTTEAGAIHSVGLFFDVANNLNDCQAIYTAAADSGSTVQAFHRQGGAETYPSAGIVQYPVRVNQEITLDFVAKGRILNVWINGELAIVYTMPVARRSGGFALWTHAGTAEFDEVLIDPLPEGWVVLESKTAGKRSPYDKPTREDFEHDLQATQLATRLAEQELAVAQSESETWGARIAADRAKFTEASNASSLAVVAGRTERTQALRQAEFAAIQAEVALKEAEHVSPADEQGKKAIDDAMAKLTAANQAVETAKDAVEKDDPTYTPLGTAYPKTSTGRRTALAHWLTQPDHPRTSRVAVNHMWQRHFHKGIVPTMANFGLNGRVPTHPELLDWLAGELVKHNWSMKHMHRLMVMSNTYRLSSAAGEEGLTNKTIDPQNTFYWRADSKRMESEVVRDSLLYLAGELDLTPGGPEIPETQAESTPRRSIYFRSTPNEKSKFLELFDQANPNECYQRLESVIPQQALAMTNSSLSITNSKQLARKLADRLPAATDEETQRLFITSAFEQVLTRPPSDLETASCLRFLEKQALLFSGKSNEEPTNLDPQIIQKAREDLVHVLFCHNDFVTIR